MSKRVVTKELVIAAAKALVAEGIDPTVKLVQERTGGSFSTVQPLLKAWQAEEKQTDAVAVPPEIQARAEKLIRAVYTTAVLAAQASVAEPLKQAEAARDLAANELATAVAEVAHLEALADERTAKIETLEVRIHELELRCSVAQATISDQTGANLRLEARLDEAQRAISKRDMELAELRAAERTSEALRDQLQAVQRSIQELTPSKRS